MKNDIKQYAKTSWNIEDVLTYAQEYDYKITKKQARNLLEENEEAIVEAMIATGWDVIASALDDLNSDS